MTDKEQITCDCKYCMENPTCYKELLGKQLVRKIQECEELKKYINEIGKNLGLNTDTGIIGPGALEHWAVVSTSINYAIKNLQQECEQLKKLTNKILSVINKAKEK